MAISARKRAANPVTLGRAPWALVALAALCSAVATGCGGDEPFTSVVIAVRTDGGSPMLGAFAGDLESNPVELEPGSYWVQVVNKDDAVFPIDEIEVEPGEVMGVSRFEDTTPGRSMTDPALAAAVRTTANFLIDLEMARLGFMGGASGGFTTTIFDPAAEPSGENLDSLINGLRDLGGQEEALVAALRAIDDAAEARQPVSYVDARAPSRGALMNDILDQMDKFFKDIGTVSERERARVLDIAREMSAQDKEEAFNEMPDKLRGGASDFDQWLKQVKNGEHDERLGAIHGHLQVTAGEATQKSGHTLGRTMAEEGSTLVKSGTDLVVKTYGKVPGLGKAIDLTKKAKEWDAYLQKVYADPLGALEASARKTAESALADRIKKDLAKLAPGLSKSTLDSLSKQLAKSVVAAIPGLKTSPTAAPAVGTDEAWIEDIVQTVADKLLADGESGIDTAVVTDDLRQCLKDTLATAMSRQDALSICESLENSAGTWIDEAVYYAQKQLEAAGMTADSAFDQSLAYGNCLRVTWWNGGATKDEALAECEGFLDVSPPPAEPTAAPTPSRTSAPTPVATPIPTPPCNPDEDGDTVIDLDDLTDCIGTPTPAATPCANFDPLCGLSQ